MKDVKRCCFAGHRVVWEKYLMEKIKNIAEDLIVNHNVKEFWGGNYGEFDLSVAAAIGELKITYDHIRLDLIIPYITGDINRRKEIYYDKYDGILVADVSEKTPKRARIIKANEYMVNKSDFLVCYVQRA